MNYPEGWVDSAEWPEPPDDRQREAIHHVIDFLEHRLVLVPAAIEATQALPKFLRESTYAQRLISKGTWRLAFQANEKN